MNIADRRARLIDWLEIVRGEVQNLLLRHHLFEELQSVVRANPKFHHASGLFGEWVTLSYAQAAAVGVRRQLKGGDESVSLKRCLQEVRQFPELISREVYLSFFAGGPDWLAATCGHKYFDSISDGGTCIATVVIDRQLAELTEAAGAIEHYADRRVAHFDKRGLAQPVPTFTDLARALKALEEPVIFHWTLLKGATLVGLTPAIQYNWKDIFEFAWIEPVPGDAPPAGV